MKVVLLNAVTDSTPGATHNKGNVKLIQETSAFQIDLTGSPTSVLITVYGSTDGVTFNPIVEHNAIVSGNIFHVVGKPVRYIYGVATTLSGGTSPTATLTLDYE